MAITRSSLLAPQLCRFAWGLALAIALAPGPAAATEADNAAVTAAEPAPAMAAEPAPATAAEPAPATAAEPAAATTAEPAAATTAEPAAATTAEPVPAMAAEPAPATAAEPAPATAAEPAPAAAVVPATAAEAPPELPVRPTNPLALTPGPLNFNLLGPAAAPLQVDEQALRVRRTMLDVHQGLGFGLLALQLGTTVLGQLNYTDRFYGPSTGRYRAPHAVLAYSTLGAFGATALVALLAPSPLKKHEGVDRVTVHKIAMFTAKAGMITQGILGIYTHNREGHLNQQSVATAHLAIGYATLAAIAAGVGAITF